jgi:hypothetical protein
MPCCDGQSVGTCDPFDGHLHRTAFDKLLLAGNHMLNLSSRRLPNLEEKLAYAP